MLSIIIPFVGFLGVALATTNSSHHRHDAKCCKEYIVPITVTSTQLKWSPSKFHNDFDVADVNTIATSRDASTTFKPYSGETNQTFTYEIAATFCTPKKVTPRSKTVLLATHGICLDRSYWDLPFRPSEYSFVDFAISIGYSVWFYDRVGVGSSSKISGYENQASNQIAVLDKLSALVKAGKYTHGIGKPTSLILVGHSYGSALTNGVVAANPAAADGIILTGFSHNVSAQNLVGTVNAFQSRIASGQASRFKGFDSGWLTNIDLYSSIQTFFKAPFFAHDVAQYAEKAKTPFAVAEIFSLTTINYLAFAFKGPVLILTGERDFIFCSGLCTHELLVNPAQQIFAKAKEFSAYVQPGAGHALGLATTASASYKVMTDFLEKNF